MMNLLVSRLQQAMNVCEVSWLKTESSCYRRLKLAIWMTPLPGLIAFWLSLLDTEKKLGLLTASLEVLQDV